MATVDGKSILASDTQWLRGYLIARANALPGAGDYIWGSTGDKADDCSGLVMTWAWHLGHMHGQRLIADELMHLSALVRGAPQCGDLFFLLRGDGSAHHVGTCIGGGEEVEARGAAYGIERHSVQFANDRGAVWKRLPFPITQGGTVVPTELCFIVDVPVTKALTRGAIVKLAGAAGLAHTVAPGFAPTGYVRTHVRAHKRQAWYDVLAKAGSRAKYEPTVETTLGSWRGWPRA